MLRTRTVACAITVVAVGLLAPGADGHVHKAKHSKSVTCDMNIRIQSFPTASAPGEDFGFVDCSGPFGRGVQYDTFTLTPKTSTTGTAELRFKAYFDNGTVSGVWNATYQFTSATTGVFDQTVTWTSGTGDFKHVRATGSGTGAQDGMIGTVHQRVSVTGI
jgi:hypothetical protein